MVGVGAHAKLFIKSRGFGHVALYSDDGFNTFSDAGVVEMDGTIHTAMIGNGNSFLTVLFYSAQKMGNFA